MTKDIEINKQNRLNNKTVKTEFLPANEIRLRKKKIDRIGTSKSKESFNPLKKFFLKD